MTTRERPIAPSPSSEPPYFTIAAVVAVLAVAGYFAWPHIQSAMAPAPEVIAVPQPSPPSAEVTADVAEPAAGQPAHPIEDVTADAEPAAGEEAAPLPALDEADGAVTERLAGLIGQPNVLSFLQVDGFVRRVVATVDNLPSAHAPPRVWPVVPAPQRFHTAKANDGSETIHADNSRRYTAMVQLAEAVDTRRAAGFYKHFYPLFQQAYEELGYPGRHFNDRLVQVLDHLIATPLHSGPLAVHLVEVKGPVPSVRPWVRYEFTDPALASLSAGQKMLLRTGPENQRRLQAKLQAFRQQVSTR
jgi:hypothetical protein